MCVHERGKEQPVVAVPAVLIEKGKSLALYYGCAVRALPLPLGICFAFFLPFLHAIFKSLGGELVGTNQSFLPDLVSPRRRGLAQFLSLWLPDSISAAVMPIQPLHWSQGKGQNTRGK